MAFAEGDIVILKSGGPPMTVEEIVADGVWCLWFEGKRRQRKLFPAPTLQDSTTSSPVKLGDITVKFVDGAGEVVGTKKL